MTMEKLGVINVKEMQRDALAAAKGRLHALRASALEKTAADRDEISRLEESVAQLEEELRANQ
jgi:hypothetical protein